MISCGEGNKIPLGIGNWITCIIHSFYFYYTSILAKALARRSRLFNSTGVYSVKDMADA
jgi:hypothetical protein